jgi:hypothetical protein
MADRVEGREGLHRTYVVVNFAGGRGGEGPPWRPPWTCAATMKGSPTDLLPRCWGTCSQRPEVRHILHGLALPQRRDPEKVVVGNPEDGGWGCWANMNRVDLDAHPKLEALVGTLLKYCF